MPIPGSRLSVLIDVEAIGATSPELYPSRCSPLKKFTSRDTTGQEVHTFSLWPFGNPVVNVPCRLAPIILIRPETQLNRTQDTESLRGKYHLDTSKFIADIEVGWQMIVIDELGHSATYQVEGVESDGNSLTSRYLVTALEPFNA